MSSFGAIEHRAQRTVGFTLVELLVATAIALSLMLFTATVFSVFGQAVGESQDVLRLHDQMRSAAWSLRRDLSGITCAVKPWGRPEADAGYFELIEGPQNDYSGLNGNETLISDVDDVLMFTTQQAKGSFVGMFNGTPIESPVAEVAWFCVPSTSRVDGQTLYNLHRRRRLARSYIGTSSSLTAGYDAVSVVPPDELRTVYQESDLSLRPFGVDKLLANGLSDLVKRENRFFHDVLTFPHAVSASDLQSNALLPSGEDVILNNVIAFDVRVFDPQQSPTPTYVDLGGATNGGMFPKDPGTNLPKTILTGPPATQSQLSIPTYCTWSEHYEANGFDDDIAIAAPLSQPWRTGVDQGTNGLDDDSDGVIDDAGELETAPPYNVPLRAIEIRVRCIEPKSKQIRQITIRHSFPT